ncbi:hypothetical protein HYH02_005140 [Chlamydomonas schloesseri]|uniref:Isochorismatase-like domain-containing protein n=1 Tax=Chlamydomonas schloesseri TaxID=2026947 RepID=A0A835WL59_9CHLO|nr:hypothetical protein HYH02_005140 [Chlamydomonas schloesseri]|eukprot:KAG2449607.1 hypothetical protein HYH02_005140 [Chlamydomonas schloesseri]
MWAARVASEPYRWPYDGNLQPENTALLVIDMQVDFCGKGGYVDLMGYDLSLTQAPIEPIKQVIAARRALAACREYGYTVIHTREGHRPDLSDLPANKEWRSRQIGAGIGQPGPAGRVLVRGEAGWGLIPELAPLPGEPVIDKPGKGSFYATDLDLLLRRGGIRNLVLCGITTDVCVHTTMRDANDRGYECLLLSDATGATDPKNHAAALEMVKKQGGVFGAVADVAAFVSAITPPVRKMLAAAADGAADGHLANGHVNGKGACGEAEEAASVGPVAVLLDAAPYPFSFPVSQTALVMIDFQRDFMEAGGFGASLGNDVERLRACLPGAAALLAACRAAGMHIVHTLEAHKPDLSDLHPAKFTRGGLPPGMRIGDVLSGDMGRILIRNEPGNGIVPEVAPTEGELLLFKPGKGAFYATHLEEWLRARRVTHLLFAGVTTEVCVQTSMREANDRGFDSLLVTDATESYFSQFKAAALEMITAQCQKAQLCGPNNKCLPQDPTAKNPLTQPYICAQDPCLTVSCAGQACCESTRNAAGQYVGFTCVDSCQLAKCKAPFVCVNVKDPQTGKCGANCVHPCADPDKNPCGPGESCLPVTDATGAWVPGKYQCVNPCLDPAKPNPCKDNCCRPVPIDSQFPDPQYAPKCLGPCDSNPCGKYENCEYVQNADGTFVQDPATGETMYQCVNPCTKKPCPWWPKHTCCKPVWNPDTKKWQRSCTNPCSPPPPALPPKCKWPKPFCRPVVDPVTHMCKGTTCVGFPCWDSPCGVGSTCLDLSNPLQFMATVSGRDPADVGEQLVMPGGGDQDCDGLADSIYTCPKCGAGYVPIQMPALPPTAGSEPVPLDTPLPDGDGSVIKVAERVQQQDDSLQRVEGGGGDSGNLQKALATCLAPSGLQQQQQGLVVDAGRVLGAPLPTVQRCVPGVEACKAQNLCGKNSAAACAAAPLDDPALLKELEAAGATGVQDVLELKAGFICNKNPCETIRCAPPNCCVPKTNKWGLYTGFSCVNPCDNALCKKPFYCRAEQDKIGQCVGTCCVNPCANKPCPKGTICKPRFDDFGVIADGYDCVSVAPPNPCTDPNTAISCANNGCCKPAFINFQWVATCDFPCAGPFTTCLDNSAVCKPNMDKYGVCLGGWHCEVIPL